MVQYRLLEIATTYNTYLNYFYNKNQNVDMLSYEELYSLLVEDGFAEADFIHHYLKEWGIESQIVFYNNLKLQRKWKGKYADCEPFEIIMAQIKDYEPDVVYINDITILSREQLLKIRNYTNSKKVRLVGFYFFLLMNRNAMDVVDLFDQIYTGSQYYVEAYREKGINAKLLRHAFDTAVYEKCADRHRKKKVLFAGNIFLGKDVHSKRVEMLKALIDSGVPYSFYGGIYGGVDASVLGRLKNSIWPSKERRMIRYIEDKSRQNCYPNIFGLDYYAVLSGHLICVNSHIAAIGQGAGNMRMFEATGMGACLLTDAKAENAQLFEVDKEIVTYANMEEFQDKVRWLTENPDKAEQIAKAGQEKTFQVHSYRNKALKLNEYLQELF